MTFLATMATIEFSMPGATPRLVEIFRTGSTHRELGFGFGRQNEVVCDFSIDICAAQVADATDTESGRRIELHCFGLKIDDTRNAEVVFV